MNGKDKTFQEVLDGFEQAYRAWLSTNQARKPRHIEVDGAAIDMAESQPEKEMGS